MSKVFIFSTEEGQSRFILLSWVHLIKYIFTVETLDGDILGDVFDMVGGTSSGNKISFSFVNHLAALTVK